MSEPIPKTCGVYIIRNKQNSKIYVGSSVRLRTRLLEHRRKLLCGRHENDRLQNAFTKYGDEAFEFLVIEQDLERAARITREQFWIDHYDSANRDIGYNIWKVANSPKGTSPSDEVRAKLRAARAKRGPFTEETRRRMSISLKGLKKSPQQIERHKVSLTGYRHTDEAKENMAASGRGRKMSPGAIAKTAAAHRGRKRSAETRARMSKPRSAEARERMKGRVLPEAQRLRMLAALLAKGVSAETRAKMSAAHLRRLALKRAANGQLNLISEATAQ